MGTLGYSILTTAGQAVKVLIKLIDTPYNTTVDDARLGHSPIRNHLIELRRTDSNMSGSLFAGTSARR